MAVAKRYVPNKAPKKKNGYCLDTKSPAANKQNRDTKAPVQKALEVCLREAKDAGKSSKKKGSQENAVGKIAKRGTVPYL